ncbi:MAG: type IV secretion system DNA-binding domain-containing protein [Gemmatimonadota bacterium]
MDLMLIRRPSDNPVTFLARTNWRDDRRLFGIRQRDRRHHMYAIGKTGTGKTTLLETMIRQDIAAGRGLALLDPHGDLVEDLVSTVPGTSRDRIILFDPARPGYRLGYNPLASVAPGKRTLAAAGVLAAFKKLWADSWGPRLEHILRNALLALVEQPEASLTDLLRLLDDRPYRRRAAERVANAQVRDFWLREFEGYPARLRGEAIAPVQNKVGAFLADPVLHEVLTGAGTRLDLRRVMDQGQVLLVNLARGRLGEDSSSLLGSLLVSGLNVAAMGRAEVPEDERRDFYLYLDEFQNVTTLALAGMLSELRKYRVSLVLANQFLTQLEEPVRDAVLGNAGTLICFRVGLADAEILEGELTPEFSAEDLVALPNRHIYLRLMVDGKVSRPFSGETVRYGTVDTDAPVSLR